FIRAGTASVRYFSLNRDIGSPSLVDRCLTSPAHPDLAPVLEPPMADPRRLAALAADDHQVGHVDRGLLLDDAPLHVLLGARLRMPLHERDAFHDGGAPLVHDPQ